MEELPLAVTYLMKRSKVTTVYNNLFKMSYIIETQVKHKMSSRIFNQTHIDGVYVTGDRCTETYCN